MRGMVVGTSPPPHLNKNMEQSKFDADLAIKGDTILRKSFTIEDCLILQERENEPNYQDLFMAVAEHEEDYKKVLAEVNLETGNVEFRDYGNYMEVPIEIIQELNKQLETK